MPCEWWGKVCEFGERWLVAVSGSWLWEAYRGEAKKSTAAQHCVSSEGGFLCQPWGSSTDTHMHLLRAARRWVKDLEPDQTFIAPGKAACEYASFSVIST